MERDILISRVIEVEKEIEEMLNREKMRAQEWIEKVKKEVEEEIGREEEAMKDSFKKAEEEAITEARRRASEIVETATKDADSLAKISDDALKEIIMRHIVKILPVNKS